MSSSFDASNNEKKSQQQFDSEGFDLSAIVDDDDELCPEGIGMMGGEESVVYEIGGGATTTFLGKSPKKAREDERHRHGGDDGDDENATSRHHPMDEPERLKGLGNVEYGNGNHLDAIDYYTDAIESCPYGEGYGHTGKEMMDMKDDHDEGHRIRMAEMHRRRMDKRRGSTTRIGKDEEENEDENDDDEPADVEVDGTSSFVPPRHAYGNKIAVYHANRAACLLHLGRYGECIDDCTMAILYDPTYIKPYTRRSAAYERIEKTELALADARMAYKLGGPNDTSNRRNVDRLSKIEEARMEKMKAETMGKLKDLGNSILGNFGLSLDNFNAIQDPNTGGYSISFNQNANKK
jgi:tetratricopeptide (TPR) repeat protein